LNSRRQRYFSIIRKIKKKSVLIGFALETENEIECKGKIRKKKLRFDRFKFLEMTVQVLVHQPTKLLLSIRI
jgi:hypothetical protein